MALQVSALQEQVRASQRVHARGAATKHTPDSSHAQIDLRDFSGVIDYQPSEFVITAWAGTPIREIQAILAEKGQYLPFDPLLGERGATVGGTVAANASGPERYRYGGVRDFIIGCRFIDGNGELLRGGGKVVKNAAGFDYPKLFVGSMGTLGVLVDVTFKVFPAPETYATLRVDCATVADALALLPKLTNSAYDINAIDLLPAVSADGTLAGAQFLIRVGGLVGGLPQRMERVRSLCGSGEVLMGEPEQTLWRDAREFGWVAANQQLIKVPLTPSAIPLLETHVGQLPRRYSVGGNVAWIAAADCQTLDVPLTALNLGGLVLLNAPRQPHLGKRPANAFIDRAKHALDPLEKFGA